MLRSSRSDEAPLVAQLAALREHAKGEARVRLTAENRALADAIEQADASRPQPAVADSTPRDLWTRERLERILGFGATSPSGGFGGSSRGA
jgi:hypothetical protein